jgi:NAD(P)-dependent dehydrogenase (short-subunit alcohol dehydrogenase family)
MLIGRDTPVLITGAGRGIGRSLALEFADRGARIALLARSLGELEAVANEVRGRGAPALVIGADMGRPSEVAAGAAAVLSEFGAVAVLVNNAAVLGPVGPTGAVDLDEFAATLAVNVVGPLALSVALLPGMLAARSGRIINVSSGVVLYPGAMIGANAYTASKAALEAHTGNLAVELAGTGVSAHVYRPGSVDTAMQAWIRDQPIEVVGAALHERFTAAHEEGTLISAERSAAGLLEHLERDDPEVTWTV